MFNFDVSRPISWKQFKELPFEEQDRYIKFLRSKYHASYDAISVMFGKSRTALCQHFKRAGIETDANRPHFSPAQAVEWTRFCSRKKEKSKRETVVKPGVRVSGFTLRFSGEFDPEMVITTLKAMLQEGRLADVEVTCTLYETEDVES